ncbi:hypothetical protein [Methanobrevibacter boviskoreani]
MVAIDKRVGISNSDLNYKAEREGKKAIALSEDQKNHVKSRFI